MKPLLILFLAALSSMAILGANIALPTLPAIEDQFRVAEDTVRLTLTIYLLAWGAGQFILGPIVDRFDAKRTLLCGLAVGVSGSLVCFAAPTMEQMLAGRFLQGLGFATCSLFWRVEAMRAFKPDETARALARVGALTPIASAATPVLGGAILSWSNVAAVFLFTAVLGALVFVWAFAVVPTREPVNPSKRWELLSGYRAILTDSVSAMFLLTLVNSIGFGYAFLTIAPHLLMDEYGLSPLQYGYAMTVIPVMMMIGAAFSEQLVKRFELKTVMLFGAVCAALPIFGLLFLIRGGLGSSAIVLGCIGTHVFFGGAVTLTAMAGAMQRSARQGGSASATIGVSMMIGAFLGSSVMVGADTSGWAWSAILLALALVSVVFALLLLPRRWVQEVA